MSKQSGACRDRRRVGRYTMSKQSAGGEGGENVDAGQANR